MLACLDTKMSNVKEEEKNKKKGYTWSVNAPHTSTARKPFNSLKERKGKVNKYYKVTGCLKILRERETLGIGECYPNINLRGG